MKIIDERKPMQATTIRGRDIPTGQIFNGKLGEGYIGTFLRCGEVTCTLVYLTQPSCYWTDAGNLSVVDYEPVEGHLVLTK